MRSLIPILAVLLALVGLFCNWLVVPARGAPNNGRVYLPYVATSLPVYVAHSTSYVDQYGAVYIQGEVVNGTSATVYLANIYVQLFASNGTLLDFTYTQPFDPIPPGGKMPFSWAWEPYQFPNEPTFATFAVSVSNYSTTPPPGYACAESQSFQFTGPASQVIGNSTNYFGTFTYTGSVPTVDNPTIAMVAYDSNGNVLLAQQEVITSSGVFVAGQSAEYLTYVPNDLATRIASWWLFGHAPVPCS